MRAQLTALLLVLFAGAASAQVGGLVDAEVNERTSLDDPAQAVKETAGEWVAFSMPVLQGTSQPCCWKGRWNRDRRGIQEVGCSLEQQLESYGTHSDSPVAENVIVYAAVSGGAVHSLRVMGEQCPVNGAGARVSWIGSVNEDAGLDWLNTQVRTGSNESVSGAALYALALHQSNKATERLKRIARETGGEQQGEAIFWLGDARGADGFNVLQQLLAELPPGNARREINFALSMNGSAAAIDLLSEISRNDKDAGQRGDALFWLANEFPAQAPELLLQAIDSEQDEAVLEQAVFAVSQLPDDTATKMLLELARDEQKPREVRRQALFWLANSDDDEAIAALVELLTG